LERLSTHKNLTFSERELLRYLLTVQRRNKIDEEIVATLNFKHSYQKLIVKTGLFISFPYKEGSEPELNRQTSVETADIGRFIVEFMEENSPIDSILVNKRDGRSTFQKPLQIKFFGKHDGIAPTKENLILFLKKYSTYAPTDISLVIVSENMKGLDFEEMSEWFKLNKFPFKEVVFVRPRPGKKFADFFRLK
jgi:hypothetical protein